MEEAESTTTTTTTTMDDLCPELLESILCRLPLISRARSKCVSKTWYSLITSLRHSFPPSTSSGLVIFLTYNIKNEPNNLHRTLFFKNQDHSQAFTLQCSTKHNLPWLTDSCNGLLLYAKNDRNHNWSYYISSPVLDQFIALPQRHKPSILARESLAFNGLNSNSKYHFKVICFFFNEVDADSGKINCQTFSAQTGEWREHEAPLNNSNLLLEDGFRRSDCFSPSVYSKGRLYWIWSLCMLVYDDKREFFKLVGLPKSKSRRNFNYVLSLQLWESEGRIHYCEPIEEGFRLWIYIDDGDENSYDYDFKNWQAKTTIVLERNRLGLSWPCAFNEELQELYMQVPPGTIFSYSFETRKLAKLCCYGKPGKDYSIGYIYPFMFNSANLIPRN
ncbi:F-box protein [Camellia lanceoleosa]|uniref:F-box protein n=1 Tax=Camellia lanceoleosa TaxID=1840588 RepID=A0ACC0GQW7_9ERIC|nr:F-box protein [Camellia lanceoleosa]